MCLAKRRPCTSVCDDQDVNPPERRRVCPALSGHGGGTTVSYQLVRWPSGGARLHGGDGGALPAGALAKRRRRTSLCLTKLWVRFHGSVFVPLCRSVGWHDRAVPACALAKRRRPPPRRRRQSVADLRLGRATASCQLVRDQAAGPLLRKRGCPAPSERGMARSCRTSLCTGQAVTPASTEATILHSVGAQSLPVHCPAVAYSLREGQAADTARFEPGRVWPAQWTYQQGCG